MIEQLKEIRSYVDRRVAEGFDGPDSILDGALQYAEDEEIEGYDDEIGRYVDDSIARHRRVQQAWSRPTDCDRLDEAFASLDAEGIVARQNFSCCSNCGHTEMWGEVEETREERPVDGYVFYHVQNTESAAEGGTLYLGYGATKNGEDEARAVARRIVAALERSGLKTDWNGRADTCVVVIGMDWKRWRD